MLRELLRLDCPRKLAARTPAPLPAPLRAVTLSVDLLTTALAPAAGREVLVSVVTAVLETFGFSVRTLAAPTEELAAARGVLETAVPTEGAEDRA